jgi:hypothetical protein
MHMRPSSIAAATALVVLGAAATDAKTLYVNASTGNDATSYAANSLGQHGPIQPEHERGSSGG